MFTLNKVLLSYLKCGHSSCCYDLVAGNCIISCAYTSTSLPTGCSSAASCNSGYTLLDNTICIDNACSEYFTEIQDTLIGYGMWPKDIKINNGSNTSCTYSCTGNNQLEYISGWCDVDW